VSQKKVNDYLQMAEEAARASLDNCTGPHEPHPTYASLAEAYAMMALAAATRDA
jgi:hypothetical protein